MHLKNLIGLGVAAICLAASAPAATIKFMTAALPGLNQYRYNYTISGMSFLANQALDLVFPSTSYANLVNPVVGAGFTPLVLQPNNPPGVAGDFTIVANANNPSLAGPFSIDFTFLGPGAPGPQPFFLDVFDANGNLVSQTAQGATTPLTTSPEPATLALGLIGLLAFSGRWASSRFNRG